MTAGNRSSIVPNGTRKGHNKNLGLYDTRASLLRNLKDTEQYLRLLDHNQDCGYQVDHPVLTLKSI